MEQYKKLDFTDQDIYIGLDIHTKNWTTSIFTSKFEHKTFSQPPDPKVLANYLKRNFPGANYHSVYEAGYCGFWIHDALIDLGINNIVINPADVPTKDKERKRKNNRVDSRKLARNLRAQELEPIYVHNRETLEDRYLVRTRRNATKEQTRFKNRVKAAIKSFGIVIPPSFKKENWSGAFIKWIETIKMTRSTGKTALMEDLNELKHWRQKIAKLNRDIRQLASEEPYREKVKLLTSIPGIGKLTAMILLTELGDILARFPNLDKMATFVGLVPGEHSSGEDDNITNTGITPRCHHELRAILVQAAWVAVRKDPALTMCYHEYINRMTGQKAIIRIARKILNRIRYVLKNKQEYVLAVVQ